MALVDCLKKFGKNISREDVDAINALIETGISEQEAVTQHLASIDSELSDIATRVEEAGGAVAQQDGKAPTVSHTEYGNEFTTGKSVTFDFIHNTESATGLFGIPDEEAPYGRGYEPSGRYVTHTSNKDTVETKDTTLITGTLTFNNPLVVDNDNLNWKKTLSDAYSGVTGKELSKAVIADGYDGIVTVDVSDKPNRTHVSEILDLTTFDETKALFQAPVPEERDLFVAHNLSAENILAAKDLGGLAAPSLAVARTGVSDFTGFGEVTLLADPTLLKDPKARTFDADIYSPRQPRAVYDIDQDTYSELYQQLDPDDLGLSKPDVNSLEDTNGADNLLRSTAVEYHWLKLQGKDPKLKKEKVEPIISKASKLGLSVPDMVEDPKFIKMVTDYYQRQLNLLTEEGFDVRVEKMTEWYFNEDGTITKDKLYDIASKVRRYQDTGGNDVHQLRDDIAKKMRVKKTRAEYEQWVTEQFDSMVKGKKLFKGFTPSGNRKYVDYNMQNVVKEMTQKLQAGENFFYGAGTVRSKYAEEMKTIKQIQAKREEIVSEEDMTKVKEESSEVFSKALDDLKPFYKYDADSWGYANDAGNAIVEGRRGLSEAFNMTPEAQQIVDDLLEYLVALPTSYFEAKIQRAVGFEEFNTAVVPRGMRKDALQVLKDAGLKIKTYDPKDEKSRAEVIAKQEQVLFQAAYHGTPHRFDKFTLDNIGGGEGAQAYGYGLYFAERRNVAEFYKEKLTKDQVRDEPIKIDGKELSSKEMLAAGEVYRKLANEGKKYSPEYAESVIKAKWLDQHFSFKDALSMLERQRKSEQEGKNSAGGVFPIDVKYWDNLITWLKDNKDRIEYPSEGQVYKVELTPKDDEYLLWDKPLSEQSEKVKGILSDVTGDSPLDEVIIDTVENDYSDIDGEPITGDWLYDKLKYAANEDDKAASEYLNSLGIKGIKYFDGTSRTNQEGTFNYVIFDEEAIQILETYYQGERGQITLFDNERVIKLAEASDLSTFLHESGHLFLEMEKHFAAQYGVTEDQQVLLDWMGIASFDDLQVEQHEQFARGFEAYLREGVAPSLKLRDAFAAFRRWLTRIYQSIRQLNVTLPPDVTEVFDRLLASEVEIEEALANPAYDQFFRSKEQAGMTDAEWDAYQKRIQRSKDRAQMGLDEKLLNELRKRKTQEWKEEREPLIEEETERLMGLPVYSILSDTVEYPMDYDIMKEVLGFDKPPGKLIGKLKKGGVDPHEYAEVYGFNTVESMVQAIVSAPKLKEAANDAAEQRMIDKYGDILNDGSIEEEVREVIHNEEQAGLLLQELRTLGKKTGKVQEINRAYLKAEAKSTIAGMKFKEIKPDKYYRAELRAAKKTITAKTDSEKYQAKLQQIVNHYLYREAINTRDDMQKQRKYVRRVQTAEYSTSQVNPDYVQNMKTLASLYELKNKPDQVQATRNILEWYEAQINDPNQYVELSLLDPHMVLALEAKSRGELMMIQLPTFDDLTSSDLRGLYDMLRHLRYVGGQMSDLAKAETQAKRNSLEESITEHGGRDRKVVRGVPRAGEYVRRQIDHMVNKLPSLRNMMRKLDGFAKDDDGVAFKLIYQDIENSNSKKIELQSEMFDKFKNELNDIHSIGLNRKVTEHMLEDGTVLSLATEHKFMMALNWGTETSREAIRDGFGVTDNDVTNILSTLDREQLKVVNAVWKVNESMWPELSRASVELYGVAPPKLDATPFTVNGVVMTGGHMRLFYDSTELELKKEQETGKRLASIMPTKAGSLHARVGSGGRPPALDIHNITRAINDNIHFIAFAESGKRLRALVNSKEVKSSIERKHGDGFYRAMIEAIDGITSNRAERESIPALGSLFRLLRRAATFKHLAYSVRNSVQQFSAIPIAMQEVGITDWSGALARFVAPGTHNDFVEFVTLRSKFMGDRASFVNREAAEYMRNLVVDGKLKHMWGQFERFGFTPQTFIDSVVAFPVWMAKYEQAMKEHGDDKKAVSQADTSVAESVGSGSDLHLGGAFMSNQSELVRTFTIFGTWFNAYYQRIYRATKGGTHYADAEVMQTLLTAPLIVGTLAAALVMDGPDDDDEWWEWLTENYIGFMAGTVPILRDIVGSFSGFSPKTVFGGAAESPARVVAEIASYEKDKQTGLKTTSDVTKLVTTVVPVPGVGNITRFMDYLDSYNRGKEGEWSTYQSLVEGPDRNK